MTTSGSMVGHPVRRGSWSAAATWLALALLSTSGAACSSSTEGTADLAGAKTLSLSGSTSGQLTLQAAWTTTNHTLTLPAIQGAASTYLKNDGGGALSWSGAGDVTGPASSTDNALARFDYITGKLLQDSLVRVSDTGDVSGVVNLAVTGRITGLSTPNTSDEAANKSYVDNAIAGLKWKDPVRVATTANVAGLSGLLTIDGIVLVAGNRVLARAQTNGVENGIYVAAAGAWTRAADLIAGSSAAGAAVTPSASAMACRRLTMASRPSGLKRNLVQRLASGSMMREM
jgi:hypothetical protein